MRMIRISASQTDILIIYCTWFNLFYMMIWLNNCSNIFIPTFSLRAQIKDTKTAAPNNLWRSPPLLSSSCSRRDFSQKLPSLPACFCSRCAFAVKWLQLVKYQLLLMTLPKASRCENICRLVPILWDSCALKQKNLWPSQDSVSGFKNIYLRFQDERPCEYKWQYMLEILSLW